MTLKNYREWLSDILSLEMFKYSDLKDKNEGVNFYISTMLCRTQSLFEIKGLPDSIPQRSLELFTQTRGFSVVAEADGELRVFNNAGLGGVPNYLYMPTKAIIANPALKLSREYTIDKDCVVIPNDSMYMGLIPLFRRYASMLVDNDISMRVCDINTRIISILHARTDEQKESCEEFLKEVEKGNLGVITSDLFGEDNEVVTNIPYTTSGADNNITHLIEYQQYLKASWFNDIGINSNYNMKRESIVSSEAQMNNDALLPLVDDMKKQREIAFEKINKMFGQNWSIDFASSWKIKRDEIDNALEQEKKGVQTFGQGENKETENKETEVKNDKTD